MRAVVATGLLFLASCVSDRYVGSVGRDGTYANRGYGLVLPLKAAHLGDRWTLVDPSLPDAAPLAFRPGVSEEPIDLDGDGQLAITESVHRLVPTLRLFSETSTPAAELTLDVLIVGKAADKPPLEQLMLHELNRLAGTASVSAAAITRPTHAAGYPVAEAQHERLFLLALLDQPGFVSEEGITRRQVVRLVLKAPRVESWHKDDFRRIWRALLLSQRAGAEALRERW